MVVMKMTHFEHIPDTCDDCIYNSCRPHPYKGWSEGCELCGHCMDDDQEDDWIYDGDSRPKNCPLMEIPTGWIPVSERLPEKDDLYLIYFDDGEYDLVYFSKGFFDYSGIIAWMPLPEPYKASPTGEESEEVE